MVMKRSQCRGGGAD